MGAGSLRQPCLESGPQPLVPCPGCGFVLDPLPPWVKPGALFRLGGRSWRIVSAPCSTNRDTWGNRHFRDYALAEPVATRLELPPDGSPLADVGAFFTSLHALPMFTPEMLRGAVHLESVE